MSLLRAMDNKRLMLYKVVISDSGMKISRCALLCFNKIFSRWVVSTRTHAKPGYKRVREFYVLDHSFQLIREDKTGATIYFYVYYTPVTR